MERDMRKLVEEGYDKGDYPGTFRIDSSLSELEKHFIDAITNITAPDARILDLGCGIGLPFDKYLAERGFKILGIDISQKHIDLAKKNVPNAEFIKGDFSKMDFEAEFFDAVTSFYAIFHIPRAEQVKLLKTIHKTLKSGGLFLATFGTSNSDYGVEKDWAGAPMAWSTYDPETYKKLIREAGFSIVDSTFEGQPGDDEYHLWVLAQRSKHYTSVPDPGNITSSGGSRGSGSTRSPP